MKTQKNIGIILTSGIAIVVAGSCWWFLEDSSSKGGGQIVQRETSAPIGRLDDGEQVAFETTDNSNLPNSELPISIEIINLARRDVHAAIVQIDAENQGEKRRLLRNLLAKELSKLDLANLQYLELIVSAPDDRVGIATTAAAYWAERQIGSLMSYIEGLPTGSLKTSLLTGSAIRLAVVGRFSEVPALVDKMPSGEQRTLVISRIVNNYKGPIVDLTQWVANLPLAEDQLNAESGLYMTLTRESSMEGLFHLAKNTQNANIRNKAFGALGALAGKNDNNRIFVISQDPSIAENDKAELLAGAVSKLPIDKGREVTSIIGAWKDNQAKGRVLSEYVGRLVADDPMAAVAFTNGVSPVVEDYVVKGLVSKWYKIDSYALSEWIEQLPRSRKRDTALNQLCYMMKKTDPELARQVAGKITDDRIRSHALSFIK